MHNGIRNSRAVQVLDRQCRLVDDSELQDPKFVAAVRNTALQLRIPQRRWPDTLSDWYRDCICQIVDSSGRIVELDMSHLEYPDGQEKDEAPHARWYQDFCNTPCSPETTPFVRREARERVRILATLLRAKFPVRASTWGKVPANVNHPPNPSR